MLNSIMKKFENSYLLHKGRGLIPTTPCMLITAICWLY